MKKRFFALLTLICLFSFQRASAQVDVTLNPVGILFGDLNLGADFALSDNFSVEGMIGYGVRKNSFDGGKATGFPVNVLTKYYFSPNRGADGFYADVFLRFVNRSVKFDDGSTSADFTWTRFGLGFGAGYKVVSGGGFVFDIGTGLGRAFVDEAKYEDSNGGIEQEEFPIKIIGYFKLGVGYRFGGGKD